MKLILTILCSLLIAIPAIQGETNTKVDELDTLLNALSEPSSVASPNNKNSKEPTSKPEDTVEFDSQPQKVTPQDSKLAAGPKVTPKESPSTVDGAQIDSPPTKPADGLEETTIFIMRNFMVKKVGGEWESMRVPVPVYYRTRSIAWNQAQIAKALNLQQRIEDYSKKLESVKEEGSMLLTEYYNLISNGFPQEVLSSDSPSMSETQIKQIHSPFKTDDIQIKIMPQAKPEIKPKEKTNNTPEPKPENKTK